MMYMVSWCAASEEKPHEDFFMVFEDKAKARAKVRALKEQDGVYCWALSVVLDASEPHWVQS